jgi:hypothetical protein
VPQFLLGSINENKIKEAMREMQDLSKEVGGKSPLSLPISVTVAREPEWSCRSGSPQIPFKERDGA